MEDGYRFELVDPGSSGQLRAISALLRLVFPRAHHLTERYLAWQYADNPDGEAVGCNAWLGGELVGHMAAYAMVGRLDGEERRGLFMLNGAVHPGHRRRRLQSRISAAIFEECAARGYAFCFGTGNRWSTLPLLTRFAMVKPLEARIGVGAPARRDSPPSPSFERVWSAAAMRWRLANPERRYAVRARDGEAVVLARAAPGIDAILHSGPDPWRLEPSGGTGAPLRLWLGLDPAIAWNRSLFLPIPTRLRPSPLNLVFKDLTGGAHLPDPERVAFRAIDFDPY